MSGLRVLETSLYVDDLDAAGRFYHEVLGLEVRGRHPGRHVFFRCGGGLLLVFAPEATTGTTTVVDGTPIPLHGADGSGHVAFAQHRTNASCVSSRASVGSRDIRRHSA